MDIAFNFLVLLGCILGLLLAHRVVRNRFLSPLSRYPGPFLASISSIPLLKAFAQGRISSWTAELHDVYGDIVRIAPNELSYRVAQAWKDIYGGHPPFPRDMKYYFKPIGEADNLLSASGQDYTRMRRALQPAFSVNALKSQGDVLVGTLRLLIESMESHVATSQDSVDLVAWFEWVTFDAIGLLSMDQSFDCVKNAKSHPWISIIFESLRLTVVSNICRRSPLLLNILQWLLPAHINQRGLDHHRMAMERLHERQSSDFVHSDILARIKSQESDAKSYMSAQEIEANWPLILAAGSETVATALSGAVFHLCQNPESLERLTLEVRSNFSMLQDINVDRVTALPFLTAVVQETLRIYPPSAIGLPRNVPQPGAYVCERWVPGGTGVSLNQHAAYRSEHNFKNPNAFVPERWIPAEREKIYDNDERDVVQPFSYGQKQCIGKNLALAEVRLFLTALVWSFDLSLAPHQDDWSDQLVYTLRVKTPLMVHLKRPVHGANS